MTKASGEAHTRGTGATPKAKVKRQAKQPSSLEIIVTGDIFIEEFVCPSGDEMALAELPYTWPDELRGSKSTTSFRELSGAPLHASIFKEMLSAFKIGGHNVYCIPRKEIIGSVSEGHDNGPFPVYLHELEPSNPILGRMQQVWRIGRSFGEMFRPEPPKGEVAERKRRAESVQQHMDTLVSDFTEWFRDKLFVPSRTPRVIVVNDRNARKERNDETSIRKVFQGAWENLEDPEGKLKDIADNELLIIWHTRYPLFEHNSIGDFLSQKQLCKLTIPIVNINCLRDSGVPLKFDVSYESSLRTLLSNLDNPFLRKLLRFPNVLIRFDYGVMHITTDCNRNIKGVDIHGLQGETANLSSSKYGIMLGTTPILIAAILREISLLQEKSSSPIKDFMQASESYQHPTVFHNTPLDRAVDLALLLGSLHFRNGYGDVDARLPPDVLRQKTTSGLYGRIAVEMQKALLDKPTPGVFELAFDQDNSLMTSRACLNRLSVSSDIFGKSNEAVLNQGRYTRVNLLLDEEIAKFSPCARNGKYTTKEWMLHGVVTRGLKRALTRKREGTKHIEPSVMCPLVEIGNYHTVDHIDIDSFMTSRALIERYLSSTTWNKPLGIAVFGAPGSGKSTIVRELLNSVGARDLEEPLEFNVSQFTSQNNLTRALHRVQDQALRGIPVAFFDEFDTPFNGVEVGWLKYFLMPLQDGKYIEDHDTFSIGKSIFIFAGGISHSYSKFLSFFGEKTTEKVPDFLSRLRGYLDVQGLSLSQSNGSDIVVQTRRAVLLRSLLRKNVPQIFDAGSEVANVHESVINSFLFVKEFKHGIRSMEAIIQMSRIPGIASGYHPSAFPTENQLGMHVDVNDFLRRA